MCQVVHKNRPLLFLKLQSRQSRNWLGLCIVRILNKPKELEFFQENCACVMHRSAPPKNEHLTLYIKEFLKSSMLSQSYLQIDLNTLANSYAMAQDST